MTEQPRNRISVPQARAIVAALNPAADLDSDPDHLEEDEEWSSEYEYEESGDES